LADLVNMVMNFQLSLMAGIFFTSWATNRFSRKPLIQEVSCDTVS